jgi:hypothetical protein
MREMHISNAHPEGVFHENAPTTSTALEEGILHARRTNDIHTHHGPELDESICERKMVYLELLYFFLSQAADLSKKIEIYYRRLSTLISPV